MVPSPESPELTGLLLSLMLAVCMSFGFYCCWSFFGGSFPQAGSLRVTQSTTSYILLCRCGQFVLKLILPCVQGFEASLSLSFSCLFWVISPPFSCISRSVLG